MTRNDLSPSAMARAIRRSIILIDAMLKEMQRGMINPRVLQTKRWERLFGPKQSMVMNLQKLVQALGTLQGNASVKPNSRDDYQEAGPLTASEMEIYTAWLNDSHEARMR